MKAADIRKKFIEFFEGKGHKHEASSPLVPQDDPTLLFANAGMNQFKDYFTGKANAAHPRAVTSQKCARAGGKHNDLENVGFTARHHTFFEMLGNFSFGDYFKKEAIEFAWEFLTKELQIPEEKLYVSVHDSDDEALELWVQTGVPKEKIFKMGDADNFWEMGDVGPCGPCSEIYYDHGPEFATRQPAPGENLLLDEGRYVEIWNLVFMQYEQTPEGRKPLPKPSVDTGMGLERLVACLQGKYWNYDTDLFSPIIKSIETVCKTSYQDEKAKSSIRVLTDHIRASVMLITDGVIPSNEGRGYVLRRIIRRAIRHLNELGVKEVSFYKLIPSVFETLGVAYPENQKNAALAEKLLKLEEKKFRETLELGIKVFEEELIKVGKEKTFSGETAFKLYDTYGFPVDLTELLLRERGLHLDQAGFDKAMKEQQERSKQGGKFQVQDDHKKAFYTSLEKNGETEFLGYSQTQADCKLLDIIKLEDQTCLIFNQTPFYAESGGQIGDTGIISQNGTKIAEILDTQKPVDGLFAHFTNTESLKIGETYTLSVNTQRRELIKRNHSATHLLQSALIDVLGDHIKQAGSLVTEEKLRFDFTHTQALSAEEIKKVNEHVNSQIQKSLPVSSDHMTKDEAISKGAMALFGEKYGDSVRVISMGDVSLELCGGTHVESTSDIQYFQVLSESSLASGIRRIEALTSTGALNYLSSRSDKLGEIEKHLSVSESEVLSRVETLSNDLKTKNKEISKLKDQLQNLESKDIFNKVASFDNGITLQSANLENKNGGELRKISDTFFNESNEADSSVLVIVSKDDSDKFSFLVRKPSKNIKSLNLNLPLKEIFSKIDGRGGGKPDMVQGSADASKTDLFLTEWENYLRGFNA